jgi:hypothetical protein
MQKNHIENRADSVEIFMKYKKASAYIQANWITPVKIRKLNITGTDGYLELDYITQKIDFYKSNYSKFNLARLFGISSNENEFKLDRMVSTENNGNVNLENIQLLRTRIDVLTNRIRNKNFEINDHVILSPNINGANRNVLYQKEPPQNLITTRNRNRQTNDQNHLRLTHNAEVRITRFPTNRPGYSIVSFVNAQEGQSGDWLVPNQSLNIHRNWIIRAAYNEVNRTTENENSNANNNQTVLNAFLSDQNPIFKSFESTSGKGLAGFIKSLKFDFSQVSWEVNRFNARAPKSLKIDIDFAPIHDLSPGLDSNGFNAAPIYNIGDINASLFYNTENEYNNAINSYNAYLGHAFRVR